MEHARLDGRRHQVVGSSDGVDVTGEMEVKLQIKHKIGINIKHKISIIKHMH